MKKNELHKYDDIIDLPHHTSPTRKRMSMTERGAQFSPFAALTGYEEAVAETARLTEEKRELSEDMRSEIDEKLMSLAARLDERPEITLVYFVPDKRKSGGAYVRLSGRLKSIDDYERCLVFSDGRRIDLFSVKELEIV